jgi:nucleoside phosphorylase
MCGIMAGVRARTEIGDVIVANQCWDWGNGKWSLAGDGSARFQPAPHQLNLGSAIRERLKVLAADKALLEDPWRAWRGDKPKNIPRLRLGPVASGAAVLADKNTIDDLVAKHRELLGVDMEYYGASVAAEEAPNPRPTVLCLKAVVDFADGGKSDEYQEYGAFISAAALRAVVPQILR